MRFRRLGGGGNGFIFITSKEQTLYVGIVQLIAWITKFSESILCTFYPVLHSYRYSQKLHFQTGNRFT